MKIPDATPRGPNDSCFRVLIRDANGRLWTPIVRAVDDAMLVDKLGHLYPGADLLDVLTLHRYGAVPHDADEAEVAA